MRLILVSVFLSLSLIGFSQRISGFSLYPANTSITIRFSILPGPSCSGYSIFHCTDSVNYVEIYNYAGICGNSGSTETFTFTHNNPLANQVNYYKIQIFPYEVAYQRINFTNDGRGSVMPYPNPVFQGNNTLHLKLFGLNNVKIFGYVFSPAGRPLMEINTSTSADLLHVPISGFENGVYLVWLTDGSRVYSTKFVVAN